MSIRIKLKTELQEKFYSDWIHNDFFTYRVSAIKKAKRIKDADDAYFEILGNWEMESIDTVKGYQALVINEDDRPTCRISFATKTQLKSKQVEAMFDVLKDLSANKVILGHNNPFKRVLPSIGDEALAKKIQKFAEVNNIEVEDQLIMSKVEFFSFKDNGLV
jgi:hypothetical protein